MARLFGRRLPGPWVWPGLLALALVATAAPTWAQLVMDEAPPRWIEGPSLSGHWGGLRSRLAERGLAPYATYSGEAFGTVGGGTPRGADWTSQLELGLDVDARKLVGWRGGSFHASLLWIEGTDPSERVGNVNRISNLSAPAAARLYQLWFKQALPAVTVKLGQLVASDDFMVSTSAALYLNAGFGTYPTFTENINAPTYPLGGPGAVVTWDVAGPVSLQSGAYVADAGPNRGGNHGFGWSTDQGWVVFSEAAFKASLGGRPGVLKLGGYYDTGRFPDLAGRDPHRGDWSGYALVDQALYTGADGAPRATVFAGLGLSPQQDRNTVSGYGQAGVNVVGLWASRPKDVLGLAASYTRFGDDFVEASRRAGTPVTSHEAIIELTYQAAITPFLTLQPDLQFVVDANQSRRDAVVFGVRVVATF